MTDMRKTAAAEVAREAPGWVPGFVLLSMIWGGSFALIKIAVDAGVAPAWVAFWRCFAGAVALGAMCVLRRAAPTRDRSTWANALVVALLLNTAPFVLFSYGETRVSSVLAGMWNATTPLTTLVFVLALVPGERPTGRRLLGLLTGFAGVLVILGAWHGLGQGAPAGDLACLAATACYGAGFAYTRRYFSGGRDAAAALALTQILCATAELAVVAPLLSGPPSWPGPGAGAALLVLGAAGTGIAYVISLSVIRTAGPTVAASVTYVTPIWSTLLGAWLLGEPLSWNTFTGGVLVLAGVAVSRPARSRVRPGSALRRPVLDRLVSTVRWTRE